METKKRVGLRIKAIRKAKGLTQEEMGALLGRSVDAISNLKRGVSHPRPKPEPNASAFFQRWEDLSWH